VPASTLGLLSRVSSIYHGGKSGTRLIDDGRRAVSGSDDRTLNVWDLEHGAVLATLEGHGDEVLAVAVTPDGRRAVSG
jgi:WD40 repeat protein